MTKPRLNVKYDKLPLDHSSLSSLRDCSRQKGVLGSYSVLQKLGIAMLRLAQFSSSRKWLYLETSAIAIQGDKFERQIYYYTNFVRQHSTFTNVTSQIERLDHT